MYIDQLASLFLISAVIEKINGNLLIRNWGGERIIHNNVRGFSWIAFLYGPTKLPYTNHFMKWYYLNIWNIQLVRESKLSFQRNFRKKDISKTQHCFSLNILGIHSQLSRPRDSETVPLQFLSILKQLREAKICIVKIHQNGFIFSGFKIFIGKRRWSLHLPF